MGASQDPMRKVGWRPRRWVLSVGGPDVACACDPGTPPSQSDLSRPPRRELVYRAQHTL